MPMLHRSNAAKLLNNNNNNKKKKTGTQGQNIEVTGGRKQGRPWPRNGLQATGGGGQGRRGRRKYRQNLLRGGISQNMFTL